MAIDAATVRKVAHLARIKTPEDRLEPLAPELNGILAWIEQLDEVDVEGVEPMTSNVAQALRLRDDVVTDGGKVADCPVQCAAVGGRLLRRAQGGRIVMTDLTKLTLKAAVDGLKARDFSSEEITRAFVANIDAANPTPECLCRGDHGQGASTWRAPPTPGSPAGEGGRAGRRAAGHQGPVLHRGRPDDGRLQHAARLRAAL